MMRESTAPTSFFAGLREWSRVLTLLAFATMFIVVAGTASWATSETTESDPDAPVKITAAADKTKVTIGDPITYTVKATYESGYSVEIKKPGSNLGEFEIKDYTKNPPVKLQDGGFEETFEFVIAVYDTGSYDIPPTTVTYWKTEEEKDDLETDKITVEVVSVQGENAKDIQDIKAPLDVRPNFLKYILPALGILALAGAAITGLALLIKRKKDSTGEGFILPVRRDPPHVVALKKLSEIEAAGLPQKGEIKLYYIEISETVRQYVGERFKVVTMEKTTDEILRDMRSKNVAGEHMDMMSAFLFDSDMVKFAKYRPGVTACKDDMTRARKIVEATMEETA